MMAGVLIASIGGGQLISRSGRYKAYPVAGTLIASVGLYLLSGLGVDTPAWQAAVFMLILGLGLGLVMQVLVLATQNAVDYRDLGVATSASTLFRQIGGGDRRRSLRRDLLHQARRRTRLPAAGGYARLDGGHPRRGPRTAC
jgi:hypothetical protein